MRLASPLWPLLLLFLAASFAIAACGNGETKAITFNLEIEDGSLKQDEPVLRAEQGDEVTISITSDENLSFHLHGYDVEREVGPGAPVSFEFTANATGSFPFTIHIGPGIDAEDNGRDDDDHSDDNGDDDSEGDDSEGDDSHSDDDNDSDDDHGNGDDAPTVKAPPRRQRLSWGAWKYNQGSH